MTKITTEKAVEMLADLMKIKNKLEKFSENVENHEDDDKYCSNCDCNKDDDEDEEEDEEEKKQIKKLHDDYMAMFKWAFGIQADLVEKEEMKRRWIKRHPSLPELFMPRQEHNVIANIICLMQIAPHWHEFKKSRGV
jgi:hypothetical protein